MNDLMERLATLPGFHAKLALKFFLLNGDVTDERMTEALNYVDRFTKSLDQSPENDPPPAVLALFSFGEAAQ